MSDARSNPVAVVTGASSGIGEATARALVNERHAQIVLVARREDRLAALGRELGDGVSWVAADLTDDDAPERVRSAVAERHGRLDVLVNNAGAAWRARFGDGGYENVRRTMAINFDAVLRLTEALLPLLRESAPSSIVNVASTAARVTRAGTGAYSASKAALAAWSDALHLEELPHRVHVGLVMPGFIATEGFPQEELRAKTATRWTVSTPERAADAILDCAFEGRSERYAPRGYALAAAARVVAPRLVRTVLGGGSATSFTTVTKGDADDAG